MFTYAVKSLETDYMELIDLMSVLGVVKLIPVDQGTKGIVDEILGMFKPEAVDPKGVIIEPENGCAWDYIGFIPDYRSGDPKMVDGVLIKENQIPLKKDGETYIHVNIRTNFDLLERVHYIAKTNPKLADFVANIKKYLLTDENGTPVMPEQPARVFL